MIDYMYIHVVEISVLLRPKSKSVIIAIRRSPFDPHGPHIQILGAWAKAHHQDRMGKGVWLDARGEYGERKLAVLCAS